MMYAPPNEMENTDPQIGVLLEDVHRRHGLDFREYDYALLKKRIDSFLRLEGLAGADVLLEKLERDKALGERFLLTLAVNVTSLFRDPDFFLAFRTTVAPLLRTYPFLRIWNAGCSTGEEVYSLAILLEEEDLLDRCRIYATDIENGLLETARNGRFPLDRLDYYAQSYAAAGGRKSFADYYSEIDGKGVFRGRLKENLCFARHNLATDGSLNEFHVILCRNVLMYFNRPLQERVHRLLHESLGGFGILGLGSRETVQSSPHEREYEQLHPRVKLYRRIG